MIETDRLIIKPLTYDELLKYVNTPVEFAKDLGLNSSKSLIEKEVKEAVINDLLPNLSNPEKDPLFYTMWIVVEKTRKVIIGGICFHGEPDENGEIEIGYGTDDDYRNNGYMTEAIAGTIQWAESRNDIRSIKAETDPTNRASMIVLEKNNFETVDQKDQTRILKLNLKR